MALRHKYGAKATVYKGRRYASKLEAAYAGKLDLAKRAGELLFYLHQVPFDLPGGIVYRCDFMEFWKDGTVVVTDCKGVETAEFKVKRAVLEETYPLTLNIVKR